MAGYGDDEGFTAWLADNGYTLPDDAPAVAVLRQRGSAYIDGLYGPQFPGSPTGGYAQDRAWPRTGVEVWGSAVPDDVVPAAVAQASYAAGYQEALQPGSLSVVVTTASQVKREKVGPIEVEYQSSSSGSTLEASIPLLSIVAGLLAPFFAQPDVAVFVV